MFFLRNRAFSLNNETNLSSQELSSQDFSSSQDSTISESPQTKTSLFSKLFQFSNRYDGPEFLYENEAWAPDRLRIK